MTDQSIDTPVNTNSTEYRWEYYEEQKGNGPFKWKETGFRLIPLENNE